MGLIALLIAYLLGRGGSGGNGKRKGGCLSRIILLLVILALGYMVVQCVAGDMDGTGGYDGSSDIQLIEAEPTPPPSPSWPRPRRWRRIPRYQISQGKSAPK